MRCKAIGKRNGKRCGQHAIQGGTVCRIHGGSAPQVRQRALERILAAADPVASELIRLARKAESEAVRRQACTDLLDRAGLKRVQSLELTDKDGRPLIPLAAIDELIHGASPDE